MERGERPVHEGHSVYIKRIESQVLLRTARCNLTDAGRLYVQNGGDERLEHLFLPQTVPWHQGRNILAYAIPDRRDAGRVIRVHTEILDGQRALTGAGRLFQGHEVSDFMVHLLVHIFFRRGGGGWGEAYGVDHAGEPISAPLDSVPDVEAMNASYSDPCFEASQRDRKTPWRHGSARRPVPRGAASFGFIRSATA